MSAADEEIGRLEDLLRAAQNEARTNLGHANHLRSSLDCLRALLEEWELPPTQRDELDAIIKRADRLVNGAGIMLGWEARKLLEERDT